LEALTTQVPALLVGMTIEAEPAWYEVLRKSGDRPSESKPDGHQVAYAQIELLLRLRQRQRSYALFIL
ncbi:hypothetical protein, partial [uncultured Lamprocystis sp.]|uniref:hypothetical protein n=1 Tax=uncultured Lamprocystis sp. TaxID=543132 RepID=UPI0025D0ECFF